MPRPRKPTESLALSGAFKKNPKRADARAGEPKVGAQLGARPDHIGGVAAECWDRLVELAPKGVLKNCDEPLVELTARLWATLRAGAATAADMTQLRACLQQMGLTPASRSLVNVPVEKTGNEYADV